jgi:spermidine synthase
MSTRTKKLLLSTMFFVSGFCGLLYQTVWLRLALANFGVVTPVVSTVIATFMLGLGIGSFIAGAGVERLHARLKVPTIALYGCAELIIGLGALLVPIFFDLGAGLCTAFGETSSATYFLASALVMFAAILPFSTAMGTTYSLVMQFLREEEVADTRTFGLLYAANTAGALFGTLITVFVLIEVLGFHATLWSAGIANFIIAATSIIWATRLRQKDSSQEVLSAPLSTATDRKIISGDYAILFVTGFCSIAMEVVWTRGFCGVLGPLVYSFAALLAVYLLCNWLGAAVYRASIRPQMVMRKEDLIVLVACTSTFPLVAANPDFFAGSIDDFTRFAALLSIAPFSAVLGYLTPLLVDEASAGRPREAGIAYAVNIAGCILGPLCAGYALVPLLGSRLSILVLVIPLGILAALSLVKSAWQSATQMVALVCGLAICYSAFLWTSWEEGGAIPKSARNIVIHRDYAATTISYTDNGLKQLNVNGQPMTALAMTTKFMAHLPMAAHNGPPKSMLVICFGMGSTFRAALSWGGKVTVVELVPGVRDAFPYYHEDSGLALSNPNARIVIDDGRRFLRRCNEKFDVITLDPPPPIESAASSLLYSKEFYQLVRQHLADGGILQAWYGPRYDRELLASFARSLVEVFPYVVMYDSIDDKVNERWGWHFLAADHPIQRLTTDEFFKRLPPAAKQDLLEWCSKRSPEADLHSKVDQLLGRERSIKRLPLIDSALPLSDDRPLNEYFLMRRNFGSESLAR